MLIAILVVILLVVVIGAVSRSSKKTKMEIEKMKSRDDLPK